MKELKTSALSRIKATANPDDVAATDEIVTPNDPTDLHAEADDMVADADANKEEQPAVAAVEDDGVADLLVPAPDLHEEAEDGLIDPADANKEEQPVVAVAADAPVADAEVQTEEKKLAQGLAAGLTDNEKVQLLRSENNCLNIFGRDPKIELRARRGDYELRFSYDVSQIAANAIDHLGLTKLQKDISKILDTKAGAMWVGIDGDDFVIWCVVEDIAIASMDPVETAGEYEFVEGVDLLKDGMIDLTRDVETLDALKPPRGGPNGRMRGPAGRRMARRRAHAQGGGRAFETTQKDLVDTLNQMLTVVKELTPPVETASDDGGVADLMTPDVDLHDEAKDALPASPPVPAIDAEQVEDFVDRTSEGETVLASVRDRAIARLEGGASSGSDHFQGVETATTEEDNQQMWKLLIDCLVRIEPKAKRAQGGSTLKMLGLDDLDCVELVMALENELSGDGIDAKLPDFKPNTSLNAIHKAIIKALAEWDAKPENWPTRLDAAFSNNAKAFRLPSLSYQYTDWLGAIVKHLFNDNVKSMDKAVDLILDGPGNLKELTLRNISPKATQAVLAAQRAAVLALKQALKDMSVGDKPLAEEGLADVLWLTTAALYVADLREPKLMKKHLQNSGGAEGKLPEQAAAFFAAYDVDNARAPKGSTQPKPVAPVKPTKTIVRSLEITVPGMTDTAGFDLMTGDKSAEEVFWSVMMEYGGGKGSIAVLTKDGIWYGSDGVNPDTGKLYTAKQLEAIRSDPQVKTLAVNPVAYAKGFNLHPMIKPGVSIEVVRVNQFGGDRKVSRGKFLGFKGKPGPLPTLLVQLGGKKLEFTPAATDEWGIEDRQMYVVEYFEKASITDRALARLTETAAVYQIDAYNGYVENKNTEHTVVEVKAKDPEDAIRKFVEGKPFTKLGPNGLRIRQIRVKGGEVINYDQPEAVENVIETFKAKDGSGKTVHAGEVKKSVLKAAGY